MIDITVNGARKQIDLDDETTPLLWILREEFGLTGTKFGCGIAACGACTVHVDGMAVRACVLPVGDVAGKQILTIEGLSPDRSHALQKAWIAEQVPQCGYCQSGMIMAALALINAHPKPTDTQIDDSITNICRCGTYPRVRRAIRQATGQNG